LDDAVGAENDVTTVFVDKLITSYAGLTMLERDIKGANIVEPDYATIDMGTVGWGCNAS
jgi:hypothetical protein